ncbi:MAG: trypsin-like peptidase domain-containing protein [Hyphomicrobiaceae bacterium]
MSLALPAAKGPVTGPNHVARVDVLGEDTRVAVPSPFRPIARSVGLLLQRGTGRACTAFCVGDGVIATNAHCIVRHDGRQTQDLLRFRFVLAPLEGSAGPEHASNLLYVDNNQPLLAFFTGSTQNQQSLAAMADDWAFAKLAKPLCRGLALPIADRPRLELERAAKRGEIVMIAYHGDLTLQSRWLSTDCGIEPARHEGLIYHTCDTFKGSSGGPILRVRADGNAEVVAINVGTVQTSRYRVTHNRDRRSGRIQENRQLVEQTVINVAIKPQRFLSGLERYEREALLTGIEAFRSVQAELKRRNSYRGQIDGVMGPMTRRGIVSFEISEGLAPLGMPTRELLERLIAPSGGPVTIEPAAPVGPRLNDRQSMIPPAGYATAQAG